MGRMLTALLVGAAPQKVMPSSGMVGTPLKRVGKYDGEFWRAHLGAAARLDFAPASAKQRRIPRGQPNDI
jgi:hypothetical protein